MLFRYREMVYRPDFYTFDNDDREEWFPNGIFNYNVNRLIRDLATYEAGDASGLPWLSDSVKTIVSVREVIRNSFGTGNLREEHIQAANLERPLIFMELAPDCFNLIDGHHRLEKARRKGILELPAWMVGAHTSAYYLGSEYEYSNYVGYWNSKVEDIQDQETYQGVFSPCPAPLKERDLAGNHIWNRMGMCLNESRRIEVYSEDRWFTLFRLNGQLYCGEAEAHEPSIRCLAPFRITAEMIGAAVEHYSDWVGIGLPKDQIQEKRKDIRKLIRHADVLMACVRVFSEY